MEYIFGSSILSLAIFSCVLFTLIAGLLIVKKRKINNLPPGPCGWPILGCLTSLDPTKSLHIKLTDLAREYGDVFSMYLGSRLIVVISSQEALMGSFVRHPKKYAGRPLMPTFTETKGGEKRGVSLSDFTPTYKQHRKILQRSIHSLLSNKEAFQLTMQMECRRMIKHFQMKIGEEFTPMDTLRVITSSAFLRFTFGSKHEYNDPELLKLVNIFEEWFEAAESSNPVDFLPMLKYLPNKRLEIAQSIGETIDVFCKQMLIKGRNNEIDTNNTMVQTFLQQLEDSQKDLNVTQCASILTDLLGAGFDTVAASMTWGLIYLTRNKHVITSIRHELYNVIDEEELQCDDYYRLPFCHATILEVLRLSTVAPLGIPHKTLDDVILGDYIIPKDTTVISNLWQINHDENKFFEPLSFNPNRFLVNENNNEGEFTVKSGSDFTFSAGMRRCPGKQMGFIEVFMFLITMIRHFDIEVISEPIDDEPLKGLTIKPKPYTVKLKEIKSASIK